MAQFVTLLAVHAASLRERCTDRRDEARMKGKTWSTFVFTNEGLTRFKSAERTAERADEDVRALTSFEENVGPDVTADDVFKALTEAETKTLAVARSVLMNRKASAADKRAAKRATKSVILDAVKRLGAEAAQEEAAATT